MEEAKFGVTKSGDPNTRFGKCFVFRTHPNPLHRDLDRPEIFQVYLDERAVEGGMYFSGGMLVEPPKESPTQKPHYHDYMEYIILLSTDPNDQNNLGGEFFIYIEDEKHTYDQACVIAVPPKVWHCPFGWNRVDRPILFYSCSNGPRLYQHVSRDPKWAHIPDPDEPSLILEPEPEMEYYERAQGS